MLSRVKEGTKLADVWKAVDGGKTWSRGLKMVLKRVQNGVPEMLMLVCFFLGLFGHLQFRLAKMSFMVIVGGWTVDPLTLMI